MAYCSSRGPLGADLVPWKPLGASIKLLGLYHSFSVTINYDIHARVAVTATNYWIILKQSPTHERPPYILGRWQIISRRVPYINNNRTIYSHA